MRPLEAVLSLKKQVKKNIRSCLLVVAICTMSQSETHKGAHDSHYHAACEGNNEDALYNEQLSHRFTILSECVLFTIFGSEVDRLIHLACVTIVTEPANGCHDRSSDGCGADASEAADTGHHRWREE